MFNPYNTSEINEIAPTLTTKCGETTTSSTVLICENVLNNKTKTKLNIYKQIIKPKGEDIINRLRVLSLFSGIGAFESALDRLGIDYELVGFSEIDKYAITSYCAVHNVDESKNLGDISKVEDLYKLKDSVDLIVGGSPCQDFSIAGKQQGSIFECLDCGNEFNPLTIHYTKRDNCPNCNSTNLGKTRSSLLIEYLRTIREIKPKYFIYENVKNIIGKKFKEAFDMFEEELREYGYNTYYKVLNAKDYGVPQNRERVFVVGIRKDADKGNFEFTKPFDNGLRLKDFLENEVEEKYYINNERVDELLSKLKDGKVGHYPNVDMDPLSSSALSSREHRASGWSDGIGTLCARDYKDPKVIAEPVLEKDIKICAERGRYNEDGEIEQQLEVQESGNSNALTTVQKDNLVLEQIVCEQRTDEGLRFFKDDVCGTIRTIDAGGDKRVIEKNILRYERTEYGKEIRKQYENGEIEEKIGNMRELKPREDGISNTLTTVQKDNLLLEKTNMCLLSQPVGNAGGNSYLYAVKEEQTPNELQLFTNLEGGKWDKIHESSRRVYDSNGLSPTIPTCGGGNIEPKAYHNYKIRKLTPKECWRLMGFSDEEFGKARQSLIDTHYNGKDRANSQLYKQAGNSIVVDVLVSIYRNLFKDYI